MEKVKVGIIGCGNISAIYLENLKRDPMIEVVACADLVQDRAKERAQEYGVASVYSVEEMLARPEIELIINLTLPATHAAIDEAVLKAGKHVYGEKPLAISLEDGRRVLDLAEDRGLRVGSAPDTFLGSGIQTAKQAIANGLIGKPISATCFLMGGGPESWHPSPEFFYEVGGGPMFDMGPYYLTALVTLLGPIYRISASAGIQIFTRVIGSGPKKDTMIPVQTPTHFSGTLDFEEGAIATMIMSFDIPGGSALPCLEIYGTEGTLAIPDPNFFDGDVKLRRRGEEQWEILTPIFKSAHNERGIGVRDMAESIHAGRDHQASGRLAYHVLEAMYAFEKSSTEGKHIILESTYQYGQQHVMATEVV
ncbi:Gfo/Idh/MocA family protein [Paenibacillus crassostreae]|uniref:Oxidoreductase n=1 Tax=Paenibacillus crassostreae TaxID=1763538 RepID=A0A167DGJ4_9BACL|nr:Gfo/Idh/MocA family oxidoreductase [Paenibacillus crassostreae]AOZ91499.1 oxidoreductase [Paenibacillus crassostreae]OAB74342.1 oxidoreductase [Paenibacillus crassostreae]